MSKQVTMRWFWKKMLILFRWKISGGLPEGTDKFVLAVAPHTSNWDFLIGLMVRGSMGFRANYLGKDALFRFPHGFFFRALGGIPVDRSKKQNMVEQVVQEVKNRKNFGLAIAPEGTRKKVNQWKTGFYYIAWKAKIPIIPVQLDWEKRETRFLKPFFPTGDIKNDFPALQALFTGVKGLSDLKN